MANVIITSPAEYYPNPDIDRPLFSGSMFIGDPDTDPTIVANQKQVQALQENGSFVNVSQPIEISSGGVPVDGSGNPYIRLVADGNYSQLVKDKNGPQKYYIPNAFTGAPLTSTSDDVVLSADTVADLKTKDLQSGQIISTKGYYIAGDGGGASYLIQTAVEFGGTPDEFGDHTLNNGNVAALEIKDRIHANQYGVVFDGVTDSALALNAGADRARALNISYSIIGGSAATTQTVDLDGLIVYSDKRTELLYTGAAGGNLAQSKTLYFELHGLAFNANNLAANAFDCGAGTNLGRNVAFQPKVIDCEFRGATGLGFTNQGTGAGAGFDSVDIRFTRCKFRFSGIGLNLVQPDHSLNMCTIADNTVGLSLGANNKINAFGTIFTLNGYHLQAGTQSIGQYSFEGCWFENGFMFDGSLSPTNIFIKSMSFKSCHISYQESQSGSVYVADFNDIIRGHLLFEDTGFERTTNQTVRIGASGALFEGSYFIDIGSPEIQAVRITESVARSVTVINSDGSSGARSMTVGTVNANDVFFGAQGLPNGGRELIFNSATGSFPDATALQLLVDPLVQHAVLTCYGQEGGPNRSIAVYDLIYNASGAVWVFTQKSRTTVGNAFGDVIAAESGGFISMSNAAAAALGSYKIQIEYMK